MTDTQLYLAIGVPIIANLAGLLLFARALIKRIDHLREDLVRRMGQAA